MKIEYKINQISENEIDQIYGGIIDPLTAAAVVAAGATVAGTALAFVGFGYLVGQHIAQSK